MTDNEAFKWGKFRQKRRSVQTCKLSLSDKSQSCLNKSVWDNDTLIPDLFSPLHDTFT